MDLTTPALLLSTISLVILALTNRFVAVASVARDLNARYQDTKEKPVLSQLKSLKQRIRIIRDAQTVGVFSLFLFVLCMFLIFSHFPTLAQWAFGGGLLVLMLSLILATTEMYLSTQAIHIELEGLE